MRIKNVVVAGVVAAVVAVPGVAQAGPVIDRPVECGPGYQASGAKCLPKPGVEVPASEVSGWVIAVLAVAGLFSFVP